MGEAGGGHYTERMVPEQAHPRTFWEHVARYRFARGFARGRRVLDVACGEGYGSAALARAGASSVVGVDASPEAADHARRKYGVDARIGDAHAIPLPDRSVDLVVSFETIEHVERPADFVLDCARVLAPDGLLIVSTPNRLVYGEGDEGNPFHRTEFDEAEFVGLLRPHFADVRLFTQFPRSAAWWSPRSLASETSPWLRIKGFWRLSTWLCPPLRPRLGGPERARVVDLILERDRLPSTLFDPHRLRPRSVGSREQPYFFVAVARKVGPGSA